MIINIKLFDQFSDGHGAFCLYLFYIFLVNGFKRHWFEISKLAGVDWGFMMEYAIHF